MKCPGQDTRYWKEDAIFEIECPSCKKSVPNPRIVLAVQHIVNTLKLA